MPEITGTSGDDSLLGTDENDTILGAEGNDTVEAGLGADSVSGGIGDDRLNGDFGRDTVSGDGGSDVLYGHDGDDLLIGDSAADGSSGADDGNDTLLGSSGSDTMIGNGGDDRLIGQEGADHLYGNDGNDWLEAGDANDLLDGGAGDDMLIGGSGSDTLSGGEGNDTISLYENDGPVLVTDFNTGSGQDINDGDQTNNDFIDLGSYYSHANLAAYNAANGTSYGTPLEWLRADQADDGVLNMLDGSGGMPALNVTLQNGCSPVDPHGLTYDNTNVICFASDALIATERGEVPAGALAVDDRVRTRDAGLQVIRWIGRRMLGADELAQAPKLRPIRIRASALGHGIPARDLLVSPQHRVLVRSRIAQKMFGTSEVLVAAKQLLQIEGIDIAEDLDQVTYVHFLFDAHQIVFANGAEAESLYTGAEALRSVGPQAQAEIFALFPELRDTARPDGARVLATGRMARRLAVRHMQHRRPLIERVI